MKAELQTSSLSNLQMERNKKLTNGRMNGLNDAEPLLKR
jgi:hypothetical protein